MGNFCIVLFYIHASLSLRYIELLFAFKLHRPQKWKFFNNTKWFLKLQMFFLFFGFFFALRMGGGKLVG